MPPEKNLKGAIPCPANQYNNPFKVFEGVQGGTFFKKFPLKKPYLRTLRTLKGVNMKRIISFLTLILIITTVGALFTSCAPSLSDEEAKEILREKLPKSYYVMAAVYGDLLKVQDAEKIDESWTTPHYFKVMDNSYYKDIASIKKDAEEVFSPMYLETVYEYAFLGNDESMSRFAEDKGHLTVDVVKKPYNILTDLYIDTAVVRKSSKFAAEIEIDGSADGGKTVKKVLITLACVDGEWLFNGPTY